MAQSPRILGRELTEPIQEDINKLVQAKFIRPCQCADWISNIVLVVNKNDKIQICIDFQGI